MPYICSLKPQNKLNAMAKRTLLLLMLLAMFLLPSVRMMAVPVAVPLEVGYNDPSGNQPNPHKNPTYIPSVIQDGYEITFLAIHPAYTLNIVANGVVVYSVALSPYTTSVVLPSWLSGQYEIQLRPDDYYYLYGYIEL